MNNYSKFKNYQYETYDSLKIEKDMPIVKQCNAYLKYCQLTRRMSRATLKTKVETYKFLIGETGCSDLRALTNEVYDTFVEIESSRGLSASTINSRSAHIIALVRYYREMGMKIPLRIPLIPKLKELPPKRVSYTREQVAEVLSKCKTDLEWLLIKILFDTGMRIAELKNLTVEQIEGRQIRFIGKGGKGREVYIGYDTYARLMRYIVKHKIDTGRIWLNEWGYPMCAGTLRRIMQKVFYSCGYTDFYPHALRHSFGSDIQRQGADIMVIKEMMGHSNIATTQRYLHGLEGRMEEMFDKYRNLELSTD